MGTRGGFWRMQTTSTTITGVFTPPLGKNLEAPILLLVPIVNRCGHCYLHVGAPHNSEGQQHQSPHQCAGTPYQRAVAMTLSQGSSPRGVSHVACCLLAACCLPSLLRRPPLHRRYPDQLADKRKAG